MFLTDLADSIEDLQLRTRDLQDLAGIGVFQADSGNEEADDDAEVRTHVPPSNDADVGDLDEVDGDDADSNGEYVAPGQALPDDRTLM